MIRAATLHDIRLIPEHARRSQGGARDMPIAKRGPMIAQAADSRIVVQPTKASSRRGTGFARPQAAPPVVEAYKAIRALRGRLHQELRSLRARNSPTVINGTAKAVSSTATISTPRRE